MERGVVVMAEPILKWAGGKRQLLPEILERVPDFSGDYYEPFLGGGAVYFALEERGLISGRAFLNDANPRLVGFYGILRDYPEAVYDGVLDLHCMMADSDDPGAFYKKVRSDFNERGPSYDTVVEAARFLFLNKHCFNGLYRVNKKGEFNVPWNHEMKLPAERQDLVRAGAAFHEAADVKLMCDDWSMALIGAGKGDFVFLDPPYDPDRKGGFTAYFEDGFGETEQEHLSEAFRRLDRAGASLMLTNHDTPLIRRLYDGFVIERVDVRRSINRKGDARTGSEVIIRNYS